jgi:hypothetical protein
MIATIRDAKGLGNFAVYIRFRNDITNYWNFVTQAWEALETSDCRQFLTEYPDSSTVESRYQLELASNVIPPGTFIVEYVHSSDEMVIGEETFAGPPPPISGTGANLVTVTVTDGSVPIAGALVQAWQAGVLLAAVLSDTQGVAALGLPAGTINLVVTKTSWGSFPQHTMTVVAGPQAVAIQGTATPPGALPPSGFGILIAVGDADAKLQMGYSVIEVQSSDDEGNSWQALTAPVAAPPIQVHIPLMPATYAYSFLDPQGTSKRRYRWRFSANGVAPISPFVKWVFGTQRVSTVPISVGTMRFVGLDGIIRPGTLLAAALDASSGGSVFVGVMLAYNTDESGFLAIPLVQGSKVRVAIEGTSIVRDITVPTTETFDIMQAITAAPDMFTVQTVPPMLTKRAL